MVKAKESQKKCPHCAESIQVDAKKCRYCGEWLSDKTSIKQIWLVRFVITSLIWSVVLFAWFIYAYNTLDRSEAAYQHTLNTGPVLSGYSLPLLAAVLALLMRKQVFSRTRSLKSILAKLIVVLILIFGLWSQMTYDPFPFNAAIGQGYSRDEKGIRRSMERQDQLSLLRNEAAAKEVYQDFLSPKDRTVSESEFIQGYLDFWNGRYNNVVVHGITVSGDEGYIDRSVAYCRDKECNSVEKTIRSFRKVEYDNGRWYYRVADVLCPRTLPYEMSPEFSRALSLIKQRTLNPESEDEKVITDGLKEVMNCVKIAYVADEKEMSGAEGVFRFIPGQSPEEMTIYVSPRYQSKDDILTAALLMHELTHAYNYAVDLSLGDRTGCFEDEAYAFTAQNSFIASLNPEERQSLSARLSVGGSPELVGITQAYIQIPKLRGTDYLEKALNFVKSNPGYQKQCSGR